MGWTGVLGFAFYPFWACLLIFWNLNLLRSHGSVLSQGFTYLWLLLLSVFFDNKPQGHLSMTTRGHRVSIWRKTGFALRHILLFDWREEVVFLRNKGECIPTYFRAYGWMDGALFGRGSKQSSCSLVGSSLREIMRLPFAGVCLHFWNRCTECDRG